ncbi:MAG: GspH/FimT family pseudopilin [Cyanobacteriota bacterium]|jgi:prepilin-type N-terminal cleavage/methylation domain-containing protein
MTKQLKPHISWQSGFTLVELLITVAVLGVFGAIVIGFSGNEWRRDRINTVAIELAGWLEEIRSNSLRETNITPSLGGCEVTFTAISAASGSTQLASVTPTRCAANPLFRVTSLVGNATYSSASSNGTQIIFTPRGTAMNTAPIELRLRIDGHTFLRCVQVSENLGLIRIGRNDNATGALSSSTCSDYSRF